MAFALNEQTIDKFQILFKIERVQFYIIQQNLKLGLNTANENILKQITQHDIFGMKEKRQRDSKVQVGETGLL